MSYYRVESLLSARLFLSPQLVGERIYFLSDLSGRISLYAMDTGGSVPEPLLLPDIALQIPSLMEGESFFVFPGMGRILLMIDQDGDENYQPMLIPLEGGMPEPLAGDRFRGQQVNCLHCDRERNLACFQVDPRTSPHRRSWLVNLESAEFIDLGESLYGNVVAGANEGCTKIALIDEYTAGDRVLYLWEKGSEGRHRLYGKPLEERQEQDRVSSNSIESCHFTSGDRGLLFLTSLFSQHYGLGYMTLAESDKVLEVAIAGTVHEGEGELCQLLHLSQDRYLVAYNIDGCSWAYEGTFDEPALRFQVQRVVCGQAPLSNGVLQAVSYDKATGGYALSFSTATSPTQIYIINNGRVMQTTHEKILGIPRPLLAPGEDASYTSHDGLRISARLYMPSPELGLSGKRPVVFYIHGGPQSQERPDFAWFSMPIIQLLTLNGLAVFVPNVRGSSGYGLEYMKRVERDWGGLDRLDHVAAFDHLRRDGRLDLERVGVTGRSYGGYMTLTLVGRHPELWSAACDLFGPYNLFTFLERLPEAWKTDFYLSLGHPEKDRELLMDRSPSVHLHHLSCPLLVIQGVNDPRVREAESRELVEELRARGKQVEYLVFDNEGHGVLKYENKVRCYSTMVEFFVRHLQP